MLAGSLRFCQQAGLAKHGICSRSLHHLLQDGQGWSMQLACCLVQQEQPGDVASSSKRQPGPACGASATAAAPPPAARRPAPPAIAQQTPSRSHHLRLMQQPVVSVSALCQLATKLSHEQQQPGTSQLQPQRGDGGLFPLLALRCVEVLPDMSPAQAAQLAMAFATVGHYNQEVLQGICQVLTQALLAADHQLTTAAGAAAVEAAPTHTALAAEAIVSIPPELTPCLRLADQPSAAAAAAAAGPAAVAHPEPPASGVTPGQLAAVASACRHLRHHDLAFLEAAAVAALRGGHLLSLEELVQVVETCSHLNHYNTALFSAACSHLLQAMKRAQQDHAKLQQTAPGSAQPTAVTLDRSQPLTVPWALGGAALRQRAPAPNNSLDSSKDGAAYSNRQLLTMATRLAWSCCNLQHLDLPLLRAALQLIPLATPDSNSLAPATTGSGSSSSSSSVQGVLTRQELACWYEVVRTVTDAASVNQDMAHALQLPPQLALHMQNAWVAAQDAAHLTQFQQQVLSTLESMGERCYVLVPTADGQCVLDVLLRVKYKSNVAVLLELPGRFTANAPHQPLGPTVARYNALLRRGCQVVSIRYSDWVRLKDNQQRQVFLYAAREAVLQQLNTRGIGGSGSSSAYGGVVVTPHASWAGDAGLDNSSSSKGFSTTTHILKRLWHFFMNT